MTAQLLITAILGTAGTVSAALAVWNERRMQRHRQPGVTYGAVTLRRDGAWRRSDLFTPEGLGYQALAARYGVAATGLWVLALGAWMLLS